MNTTTVDQTLIVETPRGPSIAGTRITVYSLMDFFKANWSKAEILEVMTITAAELDAVYAYVAQHNEVVEAEYARILQREAAARKVAERTFRERSPYPPDMPWEEKSKLMKQKIEAMKAAQANNGSHHTA